MRCVEVNGERKRGEVPELSSEIRLSLVAGLYLAGWKALAAAGSSKWVMFVYSMEVGTFGGNADVSVLMSRSC